MLVSYHSNLDISCFSWYQGKSSAILAQHSLHCCTSIREESKIL